VALYCLSSDSQHNPRLRIGAGHSILTRPPSVWSRGVTRWFRYSLSGATLSSVGASIAEPCFRLHTPLIEPDRPVSGIRLSEKVSRCRPRESARPFGKADEAQHFMQGCLRKPFGRRPSQFVLGTQPLKQPLASVLIHRPIGLADWPETEVVGPPDHRTVELATTIS